VTPAERRAIYASYRRMAELEIRATELAEEAGLMLAEHVSADELLAVRRARLGVNKPPRPRGEPPVIRSRSGARSGQRGSE
jgi:hypothetical protein